MPNAPANFHRKQMRMMKRIAKHQRYVQAGLNGDRAVARRQRQIAAGSLKAENGLVPA